MLSMILYQSIVSFVSSVAFGVLSQVPKKALLPGGFIGMFGWLGYWAISMQQGGSKFFASFVCSLILSGLSYISSVRFKMPMTVFFVPGLVPVVPGITFYEAFRHLIDGLYRQAGLVFLDVLYIAVGIASGLVVTFAFFQIYLTLYRKVRKRAPDNPS